MKTVGVKNVDATVDPRIKFVPVCPFICVWPRALYAQLGRRMAIDGG